MRIFTLVTDAFGGHGGIAKFNRDLLTALCQERAVEQVVALPRLIPESPGPLPGKLTFVSSGVGGKLRYAIAVLKSAMSCRQAALLVCAHINLLPVAFLARMFLRVGTAGGRPPIALVIHGIDAWQPTRSSLVNRLVRRVDAVISVSEFTRQKFWDWAQPVKAQSHILPNCVDLTRFTPGIKNSDLLKRYDLAEKTVLLTVARLSAAERYKGIDEVMEVLPTLAKEIPNLCYLIVGDGDDRPRLMEKARSLGLAVTAYAPRITQPESSPFDTPSFSASNGERCPTSADNRCPISGLGSLTSVPTVLFTGRISESEKVDHYRLADAFVMPGRGEGFGIVYLEAMACGIPVVASQLDASREAVRDGKLGVLVDPRQPEQICTGIQRALRENTGRVLSGLDYFSDESFQRRCVGLIAALTSPVSEPTRA